MIDLNSLTLYEVLDVDPRATVEEIKRAYQIAQKTYASEHMATYGLFNDAQRQEILRRAQGAYSILIDPERRREYDDELRQKGLSAGEGQVESVSPQDVQPPLTRMQLAGQQKPEGSDDKHQETEQRIQAFLGSAEENGTWSGQLLREIRELRGMSLEYLAQRTKINRGHLRSIEDDSYDFLPPDVYVKGFILQIAKVLGLDPDITASGLMGHIRKARGAR